jgi:hypothetical protein
LALTGGLLVAGGRLARRRGSGRGPWHAGAAAGSAVRVSVRSESRSCCSGTSEAGRSSRPRR